MSPTVIVVIAAKQADKGGFPIGIVIFPPILLALLVVCGMKGKWGTVVAVLAVTAISAVGTGWDSIAIIGWMLVGTVIAGFASVRWAKPGSYWARRRQDPNSRERAKAYNERG